jgi:hypothetical protein
MGKNQEPGSGINIPDPQHWSKILKILTHDADVVNKTMQNVKKVKKI